MKLIKIVGHPVLVMSMFLLLLISGESFGGFYVIYILLGLPDGVLDAIISVAGLATMLLGYKVYRIKYNPLKPALYIVANAIMVFALFLFFQSSKGYNNATFHQTVPLISFALFGLCVFCNLLTSVMLFGNGTAKKNGHLKVAS